MARVRLISLVVASACGPASAGPPGVQPPAGWRALPEVARAASDAAKDGATVDGAAAWGEPAMFCYATWLELSGGKAKPGALVDELLARAAADGIATHDVVRPTADADRGVVSLGFERGNYHGRLRARLDGGAIAALACFWNEREPAACSAACATLVEQVK